MTAYFDNSATTKPCEQAILAAGQAMREVWGNPSSLHFMGTDAHDLLTRSRKAVSKALGCRPECFFFSPNGTAANNTVLFGVARRLKREGNRIVTSAIEHPSVLSPLKRLEEEGFEVIRLLPDKHGNLPLDALEEAINNKTILVSLMAVNNEVGTVLPVSAVRAMVRRAGAPAKIHADCVQAFGKIPVSPALLQADFLTVSGHKIHALKGVGGLYCAADSGIRPYLLGGGQENGMFSGTEAMPAIASFAAASEALGDITENAKRVAGMKARFLSQVSDNPFVTVNSPDTAIPYIINLSVSGLPAQPIVNFLSERGICISAGSACAAGHRSHVLTAMGLSPKVIDSAVRISLSRFTTEEEIDFLSDGILALAEKYGK